MRAVLRGVLERIVPGWRENEHWVSVPHRGASDLEKSILNKLRGWREPGIRFVILRDNDGADCKERKAKLRELSAAGRETDVTIRIVCQELEAWFLGDLDAVKAAYPKAKISETATPAKYRDPDAVNNASEELARLTGVRGKVGRARHIARHIDVDRNRFELDVFIACLSLLILQWQIDRDGLL